MANVRNSSNSTQSMLIEPMEPREHFSASQLIPQAPGFIGPVRPGSHATHSPRTPVKTTVPTTPKTTVPVVPTNPVTPTTPAAPADPVEPAAPVTPDAPAAPAADPVAPATPAPATVKKPFALYDSTFGTGPNAVAPGYQQGWWIGAAGLSDASGFDPSKANITAVANLAKNGGIAPYTGVTVQPNATTFLDFEVDSNESVAFYKQRIDWFHQANPTGKVGIWGLTPGFEGIDRDLVINPTPAIKAQILAQLKADAPLVNAMDVLIIPSYLLGPAWVDRDLQFITAAANIYHQAFPGKEVIAWTWGAYHTSWNPVNDVFSDGVTKRYVQTCMDACDGMLIWGSQVDNVKLHEFSDELTQPALQDSTLPPALSPDGAGSVGKFSDSPITWQIDSLLV